MPALGLDRRAALAAELLRKIAPAVALDAPGVRAIPLGLADIDEALPDRGLPRGAVVELASRQGLGRASTLGLRLCASAQREAALRGGEPAWCAWLDPSGTLYAPGAAGAGVALDRLLVIRPPLGALARLSVRVVASRVFSVVVIDTVGVPGAVLAAPLDRWPNVVRRLALAAEGGDTCVVLVTDRERSIATGLPVAMRMELEQRAPGEMRWAVTKERRGRLVAARSYKCLRAISAQVPCGSSST
jgi:recombination protein RecA